MVAADKIKQILHAYHTLPKALPHLEGIPFAQVYAAAKDLGLARKGDLYWLKIVQGKTLEEIAEQYSIKPQSVYFLAQKRGHPVRSAYGSFEVPERVKQAWDSLEEPEVLFKGALRELADKGMEGGLWVGKGEEADKISLYLSPEDFDRLDKIGGGGERRRPRAARFVLEHMIDSRPELKEFRRPEGWEEEPPFALRLAPSPLKGTTFNAPVYVMNVVDRHRGHRGGANPVESGFSGLIRERIDEVLDSKALQKRLKAPVRFRPWHSFPAITASFGKHYVFNGNPSATIYERQVKLVRELRKKLKLAHKDFFCALTMLGEPEPEGLDLWREFASRLWQPEDAEELKDALARLEALGFVREEAPPKA